MPWLTTEQLISLVKEVKISEDYIASTGSLNDRSIFDIRHQSPGSVPTLPASKCCSYTVLISMYFTDPTPIIFPVHTNYKSEYQSMVSVSYSYLNNCNCAISLYLPSSPSTCFGTISITADISQGHLYYNNWNCLNNNPAVFLRREMC